MKSLAFVILQPRTKFENVRDLGKLFYFYRVGNKLELKEGSMFIFCLRKTNKQSYIRLVDLVKLVFAVTEVRAANLTKSSWCSGLS